MKVVIIKYNAGNIFSVQLAFKLLGVQADISDRPTDIQSADKIIFPGVGEAASAMAYLQQRGLDQLIPQLTQPFLGICLGLQLMCRSSAENNTQCLNIFPTKVQKFPPVDKVPHIGWNKISDLKGRLFNNVTNGSYVYFVHSFYAEQNPDQSAETNYILPFSAAMEKDNFFAVQFHPEKSAQAGEQILRNFIQL